MDLWDTSWNYALKTIVFLIDLWDTSRAFSSCTIDDTERACCMCVPLVIIGAFINTDWAFLFFFFFFFFFGHFDLLLAIMEELQSFWSLSEPQMLIMKVMKIGPELLRCIRGEPLFLDEAPLCLTLICHFFSSEN